MSYLNCCWFLSPQTSLSILLWHFAFVLSSLEIFFLFFIWQFSLIPRDGGDRPIWHRQLIQSHFHHHFVASFFYCCCRKENQNCKFKVVLKVMSKFIFWFFFFSLCILSFQTNVMMLRSGLVFEGKGRFFFILIIILAGFELKSSLRRNQIN